MIAIHEKHRLWIRLVHWLNFPFLLAMVWSGLLIYWANDVYPGFFPEVFYKAFGIDHRLADGMAIHFSIGWLFACNWAAFILGTAITGHWRELVPTRSVLKRLVPSLLHEVGMRKAAPESCSEKFNPAQRTAYFGVLCLGAIEVLSGFAIYKPVQLRWLLNLLGGYGAARFIHFSGMVLLSAFLIVHVIQVIRAGWNGFRAMVAGFEVQ